LYPQAFNAAAIKNTGSALINETVGPAGSSGEGAFSCANCGCDEELWELEELLLEV
jgi:hypothetical protein